MRLDLSSPVHRPRQHFQLLEFFFPALGSSKPPSQRYWRLYQHTQPQPRIVSICGRQQCCCDRYSKLRSHIRAGYSGRRPLRRILNSHQYRFRAPMHSMPLRMRISLAMETVRPPSVAMTRPSPFKLPAAAPLFAPTRHLLFTKVHLAGAQRSSFNCVPLN